MKQTLIASLGIVLMGTLALAQDKMPAKKPMAAAGVPAALMHQEQTMLEALQKKDLAGFKKQIKPGSWAVDENGPATIEEFLKVLADPKSNFSFEIVKMSDMKVVSVDANTAIVTYKLEEKGSLMGQPFPPLVYVSTTWSNHGGSWMAVFHQESTAAKRP